MRRLTSHDVATLAGSQTPQHCDADEGPLGAWIRHFARHHVFMDHQLADWANRVRVDTATAIFEQQLEELLSRTYDRPYPALMARSLIPEGPPVNTGAETVASLGYDYQGEATLLSTYGEDIRRVELDGKKNIYNIVGIGAAWAITIQQMRAAAMAGVPLDAMGLMAARRIVERKIDDLLTEGLATADVAGFATMTTGANGVNLVAKTATPLTGDWELAATTAAQVLEDFAIAFRQIENQNVYMPTHLLLDSSGWSRLARLKIDAVSSVTVIEFIQDKYNIEVQKWHRLDTADSAGTGPRAILYQKTEDVVASIVSQEPEQLPPVWGGVGWETVMHARCGGCRSENPKGICYIDYKV